MRLRRNPCSYLILALCLSMAACAASLSLNGGYGQFNPTGEVTKAFERSQVNPQFRYYVSGQDIHPNAVLGLDRNYQLDPATLWREVDMTPATMKRIVDGMQLKVLGHTFLHGFEILDGSGRPIGVWYSILEARTFVRVNEEDKTVLIDTPPMDIYEGREGESIRDHVFGPRLPFR
jgi:hypothetical protein